MSDLEAVELCLKMALSQNITQFDKRQWAQSFVLGWQAASGIWDISTSDVKRATILDAGKNPINLVFWCNTKTGEVWQFLPADDIIDVESYIKQHNVIPPLKMGRERPVQVKRFYPAPLRFIPD